MSSVLARRWFEEVWNKRNEKAIDELASADTIACHEWGEVKGLESFRSMRVEFLSAMPDLQFIVEDTCEDGKGNVIVRWILRGCHSGKGLGCPATGHKVNTRGISWMVFENNKIVKGWDAFNFDALKALLADKVR